MRIVFFGTPHVAVGVLNYLLTSGIQVAAVYTRVDKRQGRSKQTLPTPVAVAGSGLGIEVRKVKSWGRRTAAHELAALQADLFVVVAYGLLMPKEILNLPRYGAVNLHPSLLPKYRGPSPIVSAILDGTPYTGITIMLLDEGMDTGPIITQSERISIDSSATALELTAKLMKIGSHMLPMALQGIVDGSIVPYPQDDGVATVTRKVTRLDGKVDWRLPANQVARMWRAYHVWPGLFTMWGDKRIKLFGVTEALLTDGSENSGTLNTRSQFNDVPGTVLVGAHGVSITCGLGVVNVAELQADGGRKMTAVEWLRGQRDFAGSRLG